VELADERLDVVAHLEEGPLDRHVNARARRRAGAVDGPRRQEQRVAGSEREHVAVSRAHLEVVVGRAAAELRRRFRGPGRRLLDGRGRADEPVLGAVELDDEHLARVRVVVERGDAGPAPVDVGRRAALQLARERALAVQERGDGGRGLR
jgi:hypothetical protein